MTIDNLLSIFLSVTCAFCFFSALRIPVIIILSVCVVLIILCLYLSKGKIKIYNSVYLHWIVLSVVLFCYSVNNSAGVRVYNSMILLFMVLGLVLVSFASKIDVNKSIRVLVFFSCILIGYIVAEILLKNLVLSPISFLFDQTALSNEQSRIRLGTGYRGLAEFPNVISLAGCILFCYAFFMINKGFKKTVLVIISIAAILISGERSNILFIPIVTFAVYYFCEDKNKIIRMLRILLVVALVVALIFAFRNTLVKFRFFERVINSVILYFAGEDISSGRSNLYKTALSLWKNNPIIGNGWFYFYYNNRGILARDTFVHAHNMIFELLCDVGIVGTILFILPIIRTIILNVKALRNERGSYRGVLSFTLSIQLYFCIDSLLHVSIFSINMLPIYLISVIIFFVASFQCSNLTQIAKSAYEE